jgi:hypothetical protein
MSVWQILLAFKKKREEVVSSESPSRLTACRNLFGRNVDPKRDVADRIAWDAAFDVDKRFPGWLFSNRHREEWEGDGSQRRSRKNQEDQNRTG